MFYDKLQELADQDKTTISKLLLDLGQSKSTGTKYKNGRIPNAELLIKLSIKYKIPIDYLLEEEKEIYRKEKDKMNIENN